MDGLEIFEKSRFILSTAGLQYIKPKLIRTQPPMEHGHSDENKFTENVADEDEYNMASKDDLVSLLGTPVFADLIIEDEVSGVKLTMIPVLITVSQNKNIETTIIQGRSGSVKEYVCEGDYEIKLDGALFGRNLFPQLEFKKLIKLLKSTESLKVTSKFLQMYSIHYITVKTYTTPQSTYINKQSFSVDCISDMPYEIREAEDN